MKNFTYITTLILSIFCTISFAQNNIETISFAYYAGIQNAKEIDFISFGRGPRERFDPGAIIGFSIEKGWKRFSISSQLNYMNNPLTRPEIQSKISLHTLHSKSSINLNVLKPSSPLNIKIGLGGGLPFYFIPARTLFFDQEELNGYPSEYHAASEFTISLSLHSKVSLQYRINNKYDIYMGYERDFVIDHGGMESVIIHSGRIGITRKIGQ